MYPLISKEYYLYYRNLRSILVFNNIPTQIFYQMLSFDVILIFFVLCSVGLQTREREKEFYMNVFLFVGLTTLETSVNFDWFVH